MSRKKYIFIVLCIALFIGDVLSYNVIPLHVWSSINIVGILLVAMLISLLIVNRLLKKSHWYKEMFVDYYHQTYPDNVWYREHEERNFDVVALGSSAAKYAYDFTDVGIKGMNWAQQPQTLHDDFKLFKSFHSILHKNSTVLINIMPFSSCDKDTHLMDTYKYLGVYYERQYFDSRFYEKALLYQKFPILFRKTAIKAFLHYIKGNDKPKTIHPLKQQMDEQSLKADAEHFINGWKRQFGISDFDAPLTQRNSEGRARRLQTMRALIDFITEREYTPVFVIPPVTRHLSTFYTKTFKETYIYSFINEINRNVKLLDYSDNEELQNDRLYFNSFFLNKVGAKEFTARVLTDLKLIK